MEPSPLLEQTREKLLTLLADGKLDGERLVNRLRQLRVLEKAPTCSAAVYLLSHLNLAEEEAEYLLGDLVVHREEMKTRLGRDPGLQVAAIDYLSNVRRLLRNPTVVEQSELEQTERSAVTDALTGLHNRRYFERSLEIELRRASRYRIELCLLMLDFDGFKSINDLYGHPFGDQVLQRAGAVIRRTVRETDLPCRFGGEELVVILPETNRLGAFALGERLRRRVEQSFVTRPIGGRVISLTISGGIAAYPADGEDAENLLARADRAMYLAKSRGRNRIVMYHHERRRAVRYPARRSSNAVLTSPGNAASVHVLPLNLSEHGALLESEHAFSPAQPVRLILSRGQEQWTVGGSVVRIESTDDTATRHRLAVAFEDRLPQPCLERTVAGRHRAAVETGGAVDHP